jgi:hypothetical protein
MVYCDKNDGFGNVVISDIFYQNSAISQKVKMQLVPGFVGAVVKISEISMIRHHLKIH